MSDYGRRLVIDADFETAVCDLSCAIREEGLQALSRVDVREHFWKHLSRDFRQTWATFRCATAKRHR